MKSKKLQTDRINYAAGLLAKEGFRFIVHNQGMHFVIDDTYRHKVDLWPTTQRWFIRDMKMSGSGLVCLIQVLNKDIQ